jgi:hypothetical protein
MTTYIWKILEVTSIDEVLTHVSYRITATDTINSVISEGNYFFNEKQINIPFADLKESNITQWIDNETTIDGVSKIKLNLDNQLAILNTSSKKDLPWLADTYTVTF